MMDTYHELSNNVGYNIKFVIMHNDGSAIHMYIYIY